MTLPLVLCWCFLLMTLPLDYEGSQWSVQALSVGDSLLPEGGRGIEMQFRVWICGLPCSSVKAASLYMMGNLVLNFHEECIGQGLQVELLVSLFLKGTKVELLVCGELDTVDGLQGLSALVSTGVVEWVDCTVQVPGGTQFVRGDRY